MNVLEELDFSEPGDRETVEEAAKYLEENYVNEFGQGPLYITGSAVYGSDPGDYDFVVQRQAEDEREFRRGARRPQRKPGAVSAEHDYRVVSGMMRDLSDDKQFQDYSENTRTPKMNYMFRASDSARADRIGQPHNPENRFRVEIQDVDLDITFSPEPPMDESIQLSKHF